MEEQEFELYRAGEKGRVSKGRGGEGKIERKEKSSSRSMQSSLDRPSG